MGTTKIKTVSVMNGSKKVETIVTYLFQIQSFYRKRYKFHSGCEVQTLGKNPKFWIK